MDQHLARINIGISLQNVLAIEIGNGDAEPAVREFRVQVIRSNQQIGAVQGHTEAGPEKAAGDHSRPRREIAVMDVNVPDALFAQKDCKICTKASVGKRAQTAREGLGATNGAPCQICNSAEIA